MNEDRIMTMHPDPEKSGVRISQGKYEIIRTAILKAIKSRGTLTFNDLLKEVNQELEASFEGSVSWYVTTVKLDLETRGEIERIPGSSPQILQLTKTS